MLMGKVVSKYVAWVYFHDLLSNSNLRHLFPLANNLELADSFSLY
uniref:Uncharacterized protein n=1 Tax=Rhizophora mucronata TaxID=61149 RepID=A0A2P2LQT1_RHIMU